MSFKNTVRSIELASIDSATFTGSFQPINPGGLPEACWHIDITNLSNRTIIYSLDGVKNTNVIPINASKVVNSEQNRQPNGEMKLFAKGTIFYVAGTALGTGIVYLAAYY